ncbi:hypothetical protein SAMN02910263_01765 [Butyrivibrio sp. INlla16]|nr:hypothetical protein SAMN02910263_01765 [Butyrivibrio sp. INlla16]
MILEQDDLDDFPDYLKIEKRLYNVNDFAEYVKKIKCSKGRYGTLLRNNCKMQDVCSAFSF